MKTKLLLTLSSIVMGVAGVAGTFAPKEIAEALGGPSASYAVVLTQVASALLFAFAMVNWLARGSLIGGIYNRPVAVGNLVHFLIGGLALAKVAIAGDRRLGVVVAAGVYICFAIAFALVLFTSPVRREGQP